MQNVIDPVEYDAAFGNLLNSMMISMERDYMEQQVNFECQVIAEEYRDEVVEAQYEDMLTEIGNMLQADMEACYSCYSYEDNY